jgi:hypothetical protein
LGDKREKNFLYNFLKFEKRKRIFGKENKENSKLVDFESFLILSLF